MERLHGLGAVVTRVADQGCGKLRHLRTLRGHYRFIALVDTEAQLTGTHELGRVTVNIYDFVARLRSRQGETLVCLTAQEFETSTLLLDAIFSVATYDVVLRPERQSLALAAFRNLKPGGYYIVIIPRNDASILRRCTNGRKYDDGFIFKNHNGYTFYRNFRRHRPVVSLLRKVGFELVEDLSSYRQICLLFKRP